MSVKQYERLTPYSVQLEENWGLLPGNLNSDGHNLLIYGKQFGNVFIGAQPTFGYEYEGDPIWSFGVYARKTDGDVGGVLS